MQTDSLRPALLITYREVRDQLRDWRIIFPIIALTVIFPFLMNFTAQQALNFVEKYGANIIGERLIPFLLMVVGFFPISVSLVIALETFVGEKERGSIEPLLSTPLKDWQLYLGKLLAATVPPLFSSYLGMTVYLAGLAWSGVTLPPLSMLIQIFLLTTVQAVMMVAGAVVVSSQTTSVRAANLLASFIVIPSALLIQGEALLMFWGTHATLWWAVIGLAVLTGLLVRVGLAHFQREELLGREIDVLNLRWMWQTFRRAFVGGAKTPWEWYRKGIPAALRALNLPAWILVALAIIATIIGFNQVERFLIPLDQAGLGNLDQGLQSILEQIPIFSILPVAGFFWQNLRTLILSMLLGVFSFGVVGVLPTLASLAINGYLMGLLAHYGISPLLYTLAFVLPHGIVEIPAAIIASAAVLRMGAVLATPIQGKTIGEVMLETLAEWAKVMLGLVIPLLLIAAALEAWVTPRIAVLLIG